MDLLTLMSIYIAHYRKNNASEISTCGVDLEDLASALASSFWCRSTSLIWWQHSAAFLIYRWCVLMRIDSPGVASLSLFVLCSKYCSFFTVHSNPQESNNLLAEVDLTMKKRKEVESLWVRRKLFASEGCRVLFYRYLFKFWFFALLLNEYAMLLLGFNPNNNIAYSFNNLSIDRLPMLKHRNWDASTPEV